MKLSIITINYNNKSGLISTLDSVISQTNNNFEYIIIDGGSTDGSKEIIIKNEKNITKWISEPDKGIYNAMNKGIKLATGDFILFICSGDILFNNEVIEKTIEELDYNYDFIYGDLYYNDNKKNIMIASPPDKLSFHYFIHNSLPHPSCFIKRKLFDIHFYYNENLKIVSDWEFFIYCICKQNCSYKHINTVISNFDTSGVSSNISNITKIKEEHQIVFENHFSMFLEEKNNLINYYDMNIQNFLTLNKTLFKRKILKKVMKLLMLGEKKYVHPFNEVYKNI
jgi:glycosyltransferase involved in cell wall biosynthesis